MQQEQTRLQERLRLLEQAKTQRRDVTNGDRRAARYAARRSFLWLMGASRAEYSKDAVRRPNTALQEGACGDAGSK